MSRQLVAIFLLWGQLAAPAWAQWPDEAQKCAETPDPNVAIDLCTRAIQSGALSGAGLAVTFNNRGNAYQSKGEYQRAIPDYDESLRIDPESALAFNNRGSVFQQMGNYDRAIQDYDRAIHLDGSFALAYNNRGRTYQLKEDYAQAIKDYGEAIEIDPDYPLAFYNRGLARFDQGLYIAAVPDFVRAVQLDPAKPYRVLALYLAKARGGDPDREMLTTNASQLNLTQWPGPVVSLYLGQAIPQAVLNAAQDPDPRVQRERLCEAYFYIGEYLLIANQKAEAQRMFQAAVSTGVASLFEYASARAELRHLAQQ
jgi:lipoprotein NlpI